VSTRGSEWGLLVGRDGLNYLFVVSERSWDGRDGSGGEITNLSHASTNSFILHWASGKGSLVFM
jgi:hypothetical protein